MNLRIALGLAIVIAATIPSPARAQPPVPTSPGTEGVAFGARMATWAPEYTSFLALTDTDDLVELDLTGDTLWLSSERVVSRFRDGVWAPLETVSDGGYVFAVAPVGSGGEAWAFGYEGRVWRRGAGRWYGTASPTPADLYDAVARAPDDVWAVGFDYDLVTGVLLHYDGRSLVAETHPWLSRQVLRTIALDARGELWAGGCNGDDLPFLMRDRLRGAWEAIALPDVAGCVQHVSFAADGQGLAAVDGDLLWWDGQRWNALGQSPPAGHAWVRVAAHTASAGTAAIGPPDGWAVPGEPTWRGYINGQTPWRIAGGVASLAAVDYRGYDDLFVPGTDNPNSRPFLDLVTDGTLTWSISRSGGPIQALQRLAALLSLSGDTARLAHPFLLGPVARSGGDIAVGAAGDVWAGTEFGAAPFIHRTADRWSVAPGTSPGGTGAFSIYHFDLAGPNAGWALGALYDVEPSRTVAWRWDGATWLTAPVPPIRPLAGCLRAVPDGGAWALDTAGRLQAFAAGAWAPMSGAPTLEVSDVDGAFLRAPFDVAAGPDGSLVGWAAGAGQLSTWIDGRWTVQQPIPRGVVLDLQLVDAGSGWAIGRDRSGPAANRTTGVLLALVDRRWVEIDLSPVARRLASGAELGGRFDYRRIEWRLMAPVSVDEVWLSGVVSAAQVQPFLVGLRPNRSGAGTGIDVIPSCAVQAIAATPVDGGSDVWILGTAACGPTTTTVRASFTGPVSRLRVRDIVGRLFLPSAHRAD